MNDNFTQNTRPASGNRRFACWVCEDTQVVWEDKDTGKYATPATKNIAACWCPRCVR